MYQVKHACTLYNERQTASKMPNYHSLEVPVRRNIKKTIE
jgi:hypothetical protein